MLKAARARWLLAAIAVLVVVAIVALLLVRPWERPAAADPNAEWQPTTAWEKTLARIGEDGSVDLDTALVAFSLAIAPLPGVSLPSEERGVIDDGTEAVRWLRSHWDELTDAQRNEAQRHLVPAGQPGSISSAASGTGTPLLARLGPVILPLGVNAGSAPLDAPANRPAQATLDLAVQLIAGHLKRPLSIAYDLTINQTEQAIRGNGALAYAVVVDENGGAAGAPKTCHVWMNPSGMALDDVPFTATLAHEAYHCFQGALAQQLRQFEIPTVVNAWVTEGQAEWVGETIAVELSGSSSSIGAGWWRPYLLAPKKTLLARSYDAIGFYARLEERGQDPWLILDSMITTANGVEAFHRATDRISLGFLDSWATGYFRDPGSGADWSIDRGVALPTGMEPKPALIPLANGDSYRINVKAYANAIFVLDGPAEVVRFRITGHARLIEATQFEQIGLDGVDFCLKDPCVCPPGMHFTDNAPGALNAPLKIGVSGATDGALGSIVGVALRDLCSPDQTPGPSNQTAGPSGVGQGPPRCRNRCPGSNGDPHMFTVDGVGYDFQAAGEFTLLRTPDGTVELQARQEPSPGVELGAVSNNTALALRMGDRRVVIYATPTGEELRVDGVLQTGTEPLALGGGHLERHKNGIAIDLADGTIVWALSQAPYGIHIVIDPSAALVAAGVGLLGRSAPGFGIPPLPDGTAVPKPLDRHDAYELLYQRFADAWRVTDATSLFDYDAGKSAVSYTIDDYPSAPKVSTFQEFDPTQVAAGREACAAVTDTQLRDQCAYDVVVTGDAGYVGPYVTIEKVAQQGTAALDVPTTPTASPKPTQSTANPPVEILPLFHQLAGSALAPDGTLYVSVVMADRRGRVLAIDAPTGSILQQVDTTGAGEVAFAAGSVWVAEFTAPATGGFQPCSVSRLDPQTLAVEATIPTACDRVWLGTDLAAVGDDVWYEDPTGVDAAGAGAWLRRIDTATNTVAAAAVALPFADGMLRASATALFYGDPDKGQFRLRPGETTLTRIGKPDVNAFPPGLPAGDGLWAVVDGQFALYTTANGPDGTIDLSDADGGTAVAADAESLYVERFAVGGGGDELWRRYLDGRPPARLAALPKTAESGIGPITLFYFDAGLFPTFLVGDTAVAKLWVFVSSVDTTESMLLVQGASLPKE